MGPSSPLRVLVLMNSIMEGEALHRDYEERRKAVDNLSMLTSYLYIRYTCIRLQEISKVGRKPR